MAGLSNSSFLFTVLKHRITSYFSVWMQVFCLSIISSYASYILFITSAVVLAFHQFQVLESHQGMVCFSSPFIGLSGSSTSDMDFVNPGNIRADMTLLVHVSHILRLAGEDFRGSLPTTLLVR